jgi:hypothetical protein
MLDTMPITLTGGFPIGGSYSGDGVAAGVFTASAAGVGPHTITYAISDGNGCSSTCSFTITVNPLPNANAGPDQEVCGLIATLAAIPSVPGGFWTQISGPATIVFTTGANNPNTPALAPVVGTYLLSWTESQNGLHRCGLC